MSDRDRLRYRRRTVGFIWQRPSSNLLAHLTAAENVALPLRYAGTRPRARRARCSIPGGWANHRSRPRTPAAAADADAPTGHLDAETGLRIMRLLRTVVGDDGISALVSTHDARLAELAD